MPAGVPAMVALANVTLGSSASTVTFSSIAGTYRDLMLVVSASAAASNSYLIRLNGDTGSNYYSVVAEGNGSSTGSGSHSATTSLFSTYNYNAVSTTFGSYVHHFIDYSATDKHKTVLGRVNDSSQVTSMVAGRWANTNAITSIQIRTFSSTFAAGSTFALYGVSSS